MLESFSTNATAAKIRSVYGSMLGRDDYMELMSKRSVAEVADYLSRTPRYAPAFRDVDPNTVHRGFLENRLNKYCYDTYLRMVSFQGLAEAPFYGYFTEKLRIRQILSLINAVECGLNDSFVNSAQNYVFAGTKRDVISLAKCRSFDELTEALKGTPYYKILKTVKRTPGGGADITDAEIKLRTDYYGKLMASVRENFIGSAQGELTAVITGEIDMINLINSYRMKRYFNYTPEQIKSSVLPFTHIGRRTMERIYEAEDSETMLALIRRTYYAKRIPEGVTDIETGLSRHELRYMRRRINRSGSSAVVLYAFMFICEAELKNIVRIIEGVRYDIDPAIIEDILIL